VFDVSPTLVDVKTLVMMHGVECKFRVCDVVACPQGSSIDCVCLICEVHKTDRTEKVEICGKGE
jgi:hypothetical protein